MRLEIILPIIGGVLTAFIAAVGGFLVARRKSSGTIDTSEAKELWEESQAIRRELRERVAELENRIKMLEENNLRNQELIIELKTQIKILRERL